jgi:hypothetical protein
MAHGTVFAIGGIDRRCSAGHFVSGDKDDSTAWAYTVDDLVVLPFCSPSYGVCNCNSLPTDPEQIPAEFLGSWQPGDDPAAWITANSVSLTKLKKLATAAANKATNKKSKSKPAAARRMKRSTAAAKATQPKAIKRQIKIVAVVKSKEVVVKKTKKAAA